MRIIPGMSSCAVEVVRYMGGSTHTEQHPAVLYKHLTPENIDAIDVNKTPILIENDGGGPLPQCFKCYAETDNFFLMSFYSRTAADSSFTHSILTLLSKKIILPKTTQENVATVLHEAVLNALIHGNCELDSTYTDRNSFLEFQKMLETRLADPNYSHRRINVEVGITADDIIIGVSDEGSDNDGGLPEGNAAYTPDTNNRLHGRGLDIISHYCKNVSFSPSRNTIIMTIDNRSVPFSLTNEISNDNLDKQRKELQEVLKSSSILLVDDLEFNLLVLGQILESNGFLNFYTAKNGLEALEKIEQTMPDLVVLDLLMPEMDGFEFCRRIRSNPDLKDLPIVVQTALTIPEQRLSAFEAGATDFIGKPVDPDEMIARILVHLERQKLFKELAQSRQRMAQELDDAREMQKMIMPSPQQVIECESSYHLKINSYFQPSSELGGDFWGIKPISHDTLGIYIVDFSGHGVTAALNTFRLHALMNEHINKTPDPGLFLTELNYSLTKLLTPGQFATMFYGVINTRKDQLNYAVAASPNPILISSDKKDAKLLDGTGFPLGITNQGIYETQTTDFFPGDMICLYSDALIETENRDNVFLKEEELCQLITQYVHSEAGLGNNNLVDPILRRFSAHAPQLRDDLTINFYYRNIA